MELNYLVKSEIITKLDKNISEAIEIIKKQIESKSPIIIRHHADPDGYCGAMILEKAILPLIYKTHTKERDAFFSYQRRPSMTPWYSYEDSLKDLNYILNDKIKYEYKKPLVIIVDNGSSKQDVMSIQKLRLYDVKVIVIDHHPPCNEIDDIVDVHINSAAHDTGYSYSAGMLCCEVARKIDPTIERTGFIGALSSYTDKVQSKESEEFFKLAKQEGFSKEYIAKISIAIDFEIYSMGFNESRNLVNDLFFSGKEKQEKIMNIIVNYAIEKTNNAILTALKYTHISKTPDKIIAIIPLNKVIVPREYPYTGKIVGRVHDHILKNNAKPLITIGINDGQIIFRGSSDSSLDVNKLIEFLKNKVPHGQISGGGHTKAGSIRFVNGAQDEVKSFSLGWINNKS